MTLRMEISIASACDASYLGRAIKSKILWGAGNVSSGSARSFELLELDGSRSSRTRASLQQGGVVGGKTGRRIRGDYVHY